MLPNNQSQTESKKPHSVLDHAVHLSIQPGQLILSPFRRWFHKHYAGQYKFDRAVFLFDLVLMSLIGALFAVTLFLILVPPKQFRDDINFRATVAPHEVISGASSTLVIEYENRTKETLRNPKLDLAFPKHFLLQSVSVNGSNVDTHNISLSDIPVGGTGTIHIQGVMFGDVHGTQTFESTLTFKHGTKQEITDRKIATYTFSPAHSTLELGLSLPDRAIASQTMSGTITYKNTGSINMRSVRIKPEWPNGFTFIDASTQIQNGAFVLSNIRAGSSGEIHFTGKFGNVTENPTFTFHPSFVFDKDAYKQETLVASIPILPAQIQLSHSVESNILTPGTNAVFRVHYKNIGNETLSHVKISLTSKDPFLTKHESFASEINTLKQGEEGDVTFTISVRSSVDAALLTSYENLRVRTNTISRYEVAGSGDPTQNKVVGDELSTPLTTQLNFESFARYTSPGGDQIGRGPLPPRVGQKTSYWIFWNIDDTTNPIENAHFEGTLPEHVTFTGHKTSSEDNSVIFDPQTRKITLDVMRVPSTLNPETQVFSVAFEVALTPSSTQIGSPATLLKNIHFSGKDRFTGGILNESKPDITTNLPNDQKAQNKGNIKP